MNIVYLVPADTLLSQAFCFHAIRLYRKVFTYEAFIVILRHSTGQKSPNGTMAFIYFTIIFFPIEFGILHDIASLLGDWHSDAVYLCLNSPLAQCFSVKYTIAL